MQTLELIIPGKFYDSQIYDGRLYLWDVSGSFTIIDWDKLVEQINVSAGLEIVFKLALQEGDSLYKNPLMKDFEVRSLMQSKFQELSKFKIELTKKALSKCTILVQDSPLPFPHADSAVHYKKIYTGGQSGVSVSSCSMGRERNPSIKASKRLFDIPVTNISTSHRTLAVAAGNEGFFDYSLITVFNSYNKPRMLSKEHCNFAQWMYPSIFGSSYFNNGYFADFRENKRRENTREFEEEEFEQKEIQLVPPNSLEIEEGVWENRKRLSSVKREFTRLYSLQDIFGRINFNKTSKDHNAEEKRFTWGGRDKIFVADRDSINLIQYIPQARGRSTEFLDLGTVNLKEIGLDGKNLDSDIISADSSYFGVVLEKEDGLLILASSLETHFISGEPVNWRVFPKSKNYINQLHVINDDSIHIYFFVQDYFIDQNQKKLGLSMSSFKSDVNKPV